MNRAFSTKTILVLGSLALTGLAGCGRRGDLEPPPGSLAAPPAAADGEEAAPIGTGNPIDGLPVRRDKIVPPRGPFILDKIL